MVSIAITADITTSISTKAAVNANTATGITTAVISLIADWANPQKEGDRE